MTAHLCDVCLFGGAQYRGGTDLRATEWKGMLAPPDFGRMLSNDRFIRMMRYLARGPDDTETLKQGDPWAQKRWMVDGFNATRKSQFKCGWIVTSDESMIQWTGASRSPRGIIWCGSQSLYLSLALSVLDSDWGSGQGQD